MKKGVISKGGYTQKAFQEKELRDIAHKMVEEYGERYPTRTIGHHHYIRRRHLQQFIYEVLTNINI